MSPTAVYFMLNYSKKSFALSFQEEFANSANSIIKIAFLRKIVVMYGKHYKSIILYATA